MMHNWTLKLRQVKCPRRRHRCRDRSLLLPPLLPPTVAGSVALYPHVDIGSSVTPALYRAPQTPCYFGIHHIYRTSVKITRQRERPSPGGPTITLSCWAFHIAETLNAMSLFHLFVQMGKRRDDEEGKAREWGGYRRYTRNRSVQSPLCDWPSDSVTIIMWW